MVSWNIFIPLMSLCLLAGSCSSQESAVADKVGELPTDDQSSQVSQPENIADPKTTNDPINPLPKTEVPADDGGDVSHIVTPVVVKPETRDAAESGDWTLPQAQLPQPGQGISLEELVEQSINNSFTIARQQETIEQSDIKFLRERANFLLPEEGEDDDKGGILDIGELHRLDELATLRESERENLYTLGSELVNDIIESYINAQKQTALLAIYESQHEYFEIIKSKIATLITVGEAPLTWKNKVEVYILDVTSRIELAVGDLRNHLAQLKFLAGIESDVDIKIAGLPLPIPEELDLPDLPQLLPVSIEVSPERAVYNTKLAAFDSAIASFQWQLAQLTKDEKKRQFTLESSIDQQISERNQNIISLKELESRLEREIETSIAHLRTSLGYIAILAADNTNKRDLYSKSITLYDQGDLEFFKLVEISSFIFTNEIHSIKRHFDLLKGTADLDRFLQQGIYRMPLNLLEVP